MIQPTTINDWASIIGVPMFAFVFGILFTRIVDSLRQEKKQ
jgi:hypothetical protein